MKKKRERCVSPENALLKIPPEFTSSDGEIQTLVESLQNSESFEGQQQVILQVSCSFFFLKGTISKKWVDFVAGNVFKNSKLR